MAKDNKFLSTNKQKLALYCDFYDVNPKDEESLKLVEKEEWLDSLMTGYYEMGRINQEICTEFLVCDCEDWYFKQD